MPAISIRWLPSPATLATASSDADILDTESIGALLEEVAPDVVMHLAAESHVDRSIDGPGAFIQTNVVGTFTLLQAALGYWRTLDRQKSASFRFHHVSTDEVFGSLGPEGRFREESPYQPNSPYSASKAGSDHLVRAWHHTYGLPVVISNCSNNYGPYQFPEKLIPLMILNCLEGKPLPVYGTGENVRDWLYVEDHVRALVTRRRTGPLRRDLQRRRQRGANQHRGRPPALRDHGRDGAAPVGYACGPDHFRRRPARPRPPLCHRQHEDQRGNSAGSPGRRSRPGWQRRCAGISTIATGGSGSAPAPIGGERLGLAS